MDAVLEALKNLSPSVCTYEEWVQVGMALKAEGYDCATWDEWSRDDSRYTEGACEKKWRTFTEEGVTGGTIIHIAENYGWRRPQAESWNWDTIISPEDIIEAKSSVRAKKTVKPLTLSEQCEQIKHYLNARFEGDDHVGYCVNSMQRDDGKWTPASVGTYGLTAGELIGKLNKVQRKAQQGLPTGLDEAIGTVNTEAGAWIRFNPLDGDGVKDANITAYRYALVESDSLPPEEQESIIRALNLPAAALVSSGKKSVHAIVHIDALDKGEYKRRVDELYTVCEEAGLVIDRQNKNPSRLSRMPGIQRGDNWQRLIDTNIGAADWKAWKEWLVSKKDDLPDPVPISEIFFDPPPLSPELIEGVLRKGHKGVCAGPSKIGKSFMFIELAAALAEGRKWLDFQCQRSKVLYFNFEIDPASFYRRIIDTYKALGIATPAFPQNFLVENLRGKTKPIDEMTPSIINKIVNFGADVIMLDPIYKLLNGDENNASDMAKFVGQFDRICAESGCTLLYTHHHSKGEQGFKTAQDRMSGSGVFGRDNDMICDLLPLEATAAQRLNAGVRPDAKAVKMEFTLREFASPDPMYMWFDYPIHKEDPSLETCPETTQEKARVGWSEQKKKNRQRETNLLFDAFQWISADGSKVTTKGLTDRINEMANADYSYQTIRDWVDRSERYKRENGAVVDTLKND